MRNPKITATPVATSQIDRISLPNSPSPAREPEAVPTAAEGEAATWLGNGLRSISTRATGAKNVFRLIDSGSPGNSAPRMNADTSPPGGGQPVLDRAADATKVRLPPDGLKPLEVSMASTGSF